MSRGFTIVVHVIGLLAFWSAALSGSAMAYETELRAAAKGLAAQMEEAGQKSGTVLDFTDLQGSPNELGRFLAQELSSRLVEASKRMSFVDRANLQVLLREHKLSSEGLINPESSRKLGNLVGIDTIIFGTITILEDKLRLSLRAVAVETGRIVATQSTTLAGTGGLASLYTRGVAGSPPTDRPVASKPASARDRFRLDSLRLASRGVSVSPRIAAGHSALVVFVLENLSGTSFDAALERDSITLGTCTTNGGYPPDATGIAVTNRHGEHTWRHIPAGAKITFSLSGLLCGSLLTEKSTDFAGSLLIKAGGEVFSHPISVEGIPVKVDQSR